MMLGVSGQAAAAFEHFRFTPKLTVTADVPERQLGAKR
jgi:hypothetical protein